MVNRLTAKGRNDGPPRLATRDETGCVLEKRGARSTVSAAAVVRKLGASVAVLVVLLPGISTADDWPQWRGPERTGKSKETGLLRSWPKGGPKLLWKATGLGGTYSTPSVSNGRIYGMGFRGGDEVVWALREADGSEVWVRRIAAANRRIGVGDGPRSTPTVDGDRVYALGVSGDLACLDAATGEIRWHVNLRRDFGGRMMSGWGYSESPLIDGNKVIATPGGRTATLVALDKETGETIWQSAVPGGDGAGYSSVIVAEVDGLRQYIQFLGGGVVGVAADDGRFLWRYDKPHNTTANCSTPLFGNNCVFAASAYGTGGGLVRLTRRGQAVSAREVFFNRQMRNHHGGMVVVRGYIYGEGGGRLTCLDSRTGRVQWRSSAAGKGSISFADGCLYYRNERGPMILVEANPRRYIERGRFDPPDQSGKNTWPHPVIANGRLYLQDQGVLLCYDIRRR